MSTLRPVEYYVRWILEESIADLRKNPNEIDHIFSGLLDCGMDKFYGQKLIDEIRCFFRDNDIPVTSHYGQNTSPAPAIAVHLLSSQEEQKYDTFQDIHSFIRCPKPAAVIRGPFAAEAYDPSDGKLIFPATFSLDGFIRGRKIFSERDDAVYTITGRIQCNEPGTPVYELEPQYIQIVDENGDIPEDIQMDRLSLLSSIDFQVYKIGSTPFRESFELLTRAANNPDQAIWLYYVTLYVLLRNKHKFEAHGLELQSHSAGDAYREINRHPNNFFGRSIRISFLVHHMWREEITPLELVGININAESNVIDYVRSQVTLD